MENEAHIDYSPLLEAARAIAGRAKRFARPEETSAIESSLAEMSASLDRFSLAKGKLFSVARSIEARLSKGEPELSDVITSGPVS